MRFFSILCATLLLNACTSAVQFDTQEVDPSLKPSTVSNNVTPHRNKQVLWGGVIMNTRNLKQQTEIEILAYPLDASHLPDTDQKPQGRFLVRHSGFLEPSEYGRDRLLTVLGRIERIKKSKVGESDYLYPVIASRQMHLWPKGSGQSKTRFSIGIGVKL